MAASIFRNSAAQKAARARRGCLARKDELVEEIYACKRYFSKTDLRSMSCDQLKEIYLTLTNGLPLDEFDDEVLGLPLSGHVIA